MLCVGTLRHSAKRSRTVELDEAVVRAVYAEHGAVLLRYALRLTGDQGHAEDLVQEVSMMSPSAVASQMKALWSSFQ